MKSLPENLEFYRRTPQFTENTIPKGFLNEHTTKEGTWALIIIEQGELNYIINEPKIETIKLTLGINGVIEPQVKHQVYAESNVRFHLEFYK